MCTVNPLFYLIYIYAPCFNLNLITLHHSLSAFCCSLTLKEHLDKIMTAAIHHGDGRPLSFLCACLVKGVVPKHPYKRTRRPFYSRQSAAQSEECALNTLSYNFYLCPWYFQQYLNLAEKL
jgi:hypothetical protein